MIAHRDFLLLVATAAIAATSAFGQAGPVVPANGGTPGAPSLPDFSGIWSHPSFPGFEPPASGPGPVVNKSRLPQVNFDGRILPPTNNILVSNPAQLVGDDTNPILKPNAAEAVKKKGEMELGGMVGPTPTIQCWPSGHSLRAGFLTSAARRGASIFKMMDVSRQPSVETLRGCGRDPEIFKDRAGPGLL
jgi:hypothetical protein